MKDSTQPVYVMNKRKGKILILIGAIIMFIGAFAIFTDLRMAVIFLLIGWVITMAGKIRRWWHN